VTNLRQLVDKEMEVEFNPHPLTPSPSEKEAGNQKRHKLYSRMYEDVVLCDSVSDFIGKL